MRQISHSQNFSQDHRLIEKLVRRSNIGPDDLVVEIGAGHGEITRVLSHYCQAVIAIEKDQKLSNQLRNNLSLKSNVTIFNVDILGFKFPNGPYKVFSNIPFNYTAA